PLLEIIHITGFAVTVGTIALVDLRMMGLAFLRKSSANLAGEMAPWTLAGLAAMLTTGPLLFTSDPVMYLHNAGFKFKMWVLLAAIIFNYTVHRKVAQTPNASVALAASVGVISILLWVSVVFGG